MNKTTEAFNNKGTLTSQTPLKSTNSIMNTTIEDSSRWILSKSQKNQNKLSQTITNSRKQNLAKLSQMSKDISNNYLEYEKYPGPLNLHNINVALNKGVWTDIGSTRKPPGPNIENLVTKTKTGF